ncbi:MFS transporter [Meiothermus ruber]|uniref:Major facilitator superfamily MFS_1 n=1 Tax=Meiothermus ruber (strain ATCC 35948 / DSM 1279 / VKM B-1258 / 21) TaxID=504728 RepID=D3PLH7_MEIRD|nr:MFS transporter [Meiothermus ruber]ADD29068.1 major facilitator superfamily MFS_1 [Meiothermus ruber DSM 1279]AGK05481.1 major facilitator superfamily protein [Meiothermus ruber DSM 1279]MCL6528599.1 MFS transporter [Meiothermus ruber]GAO75989.1 major facilitator superfamily protein [Meiothermus ruber H328]
MPAAFRIFAILLLAYFLSYFFRATNAVISPDLRRDLGLTPAELGLMTSLFYLTFAIAQLPLGALLDRFGPRFVHPALMLLGAMGALIFASAQDFLTLSVGRALLGIGFAAALMGALKAFSLWFPAHRYASISSLYVALGASGAIAASSPLAWLKEQIGWRGVFEWGALVIVLVALVVALGVRNAPKGMALPQSTQAGNASLIWRSSQFWRMGWLNFMVGGGFLAWQTLWGGDFLFKVRGLGSLEVGSVLFTFSLAALLGFLLCGPLADRWGLPRVLLSASLGFTLGPLLLALWPQMPALGLYLTYGLMGFTGAFNILSLAQARLVFPTELTGRAVTAINFMGFMGVFLLQWGMGVVLGLSEYSTALLVWATLIALAIIGYLPLALGQRKSAL